MNITQIIPGERQSMDIVYKYNSCNVLVFISTEGSKGNDTCNPYLSHLPDNSSNVYIHPVV